MIRFFIGLAIGYVFSDLISAKFPKATQYKVSPNLFREWLQPQISTKQSVSGYLGWEKMKK